MGGGEVWLVGRASKRSGQAAGGRAAGQRAAGQAAGAHTEAPSMQQGACCMNNSGEAIMHVFFPDVETLMLPQESGYLNLESRIAHVKVTSAVQGRVRACFMHRPSHVA